MREKVKMSKKDKGITLIALVITVIILIILASIGIGAVTGENGLFRKSKESTNIYIGASLDESKAMDEFEKIIAENNVKAEPITVEDGTFWIPEGFKKVGNSNKIANGIVAEDSNGNQWVWIPCYVNEDDKGEGTVSVKYEDGEKVTSIENVLDPLLRTEYESVKKYGGYYIGRYEAGDGTLTDQNSSRMRVSGDSVKNVVTIKKEQVPYNYLTCIDASNLSKNFSNANNYQTNMFTRLCSNASWSTALRFIEDYCENYMSHWTVNGSIIGNFKDAKFNYSVMNESSKETIEKPADASLLLLTGKTSSLCNIYDLGGNLSEFTLERQNGCAYWVSKGGSFNTSSTGVITSGYGIPSDRIGFRIALFLD